MKTNNKLREALKTVKRYLDGYTVNILELRRKVDAALAAPLRNCEVGTAEEQEKRYAVFVKEHWTLGKTALQWAQMPYEEGGVK